LLTLKDAREANSKKTKSTGDGGGRNGTSETGSSSDRVELMMMRTRRNSSHSEITETIDGREDAQQLDPRKARGASTKGSSRVQVSHQPKPISMPRLPWHDAEQR
jgi:hypothetical protein